MLPGKTNDILELLAAENAPLTMAMPGNYYGSYGPVAPGTANFTVRRPSDPEHPLKRFPVQLSPDSYVTILVSSKDGQPVVEAIDDTIDPKKLTGGRVIIRQYVAGAHVTAAVGTAQTTPVLNYGEMAVLDNLPTTQTVINIQATLPSGPPRNWTLPADFTTTPHATVLIGIDPYGHFRPRLAVDGTMAGPGAGGSTR